LNEWVKTNFPTSLQWRNVRVGPIPGTPEDRIYAGLRRWVDFIIYHEDTIILVEGKMRPEPAGVAELDLYGRLFPKTPEFKTFWDKPVRKIYLTTKYDETIDAMCKERGIELVVYEPEWVKVWWQTEAIRK